MSATFHVSDRKAVPGFVDHGAWRPVRLWLYVVVVAPEKPTVKYRLGEVVLALVVPTAALTAPRIIAIP